MATLAWRSLHILPVRGTSYHSLQTASSLPQTASSHPPTCAEARNLCHAQLLCYIEKYAEAIWLLLSSAQTDGVALSDAWCAHIHAQLLFLLECFAAPVNASLCVIIINHARIQFNNN